MATVNFTSMTELAEANTRAGHHFFEQGDTDRDVRRGLVDGRWVLAQRTEPDRVAIYEASEHGHLAWRAQEPNWVSALLWVSNAKP